MQVAYFGEYSFEGPPTDITYALQVHTSSGPHGRDLLCAGLGTK